MGNRYPLRRGDSNGIDHGLRRTLTRHDRKVRHARKNPTSGDSDRRFALGHCAHSLSEGDVLNPQNGTCSRARNRTRNSSTRVRLVRLVRRNRRRRR